MKPWMMALAIGRRRELVVKTYTANATAPIPFGVSRLESIVGKGAAGSPGTSGTSGRAGYMLTVHQSYKRIDGGPDFVNIGTPQGPYPGAVPADYCDTQPTSGSVYYEVTTCRYYDYRYIPGTGTDPTIGASATGFGQTFIGGTGGEATPREVKNVAVTPGTNYQLVIPAGASITISYYQ